MHSSDTAEKPHRIVIVGGGVGGLTLATRLGETLEKDRFTEVLLLDGSSTHFWKPLLHEAAAGRLDPAAHEIQYAVHAKMNGFLFEQGMLVSVDRTCRTVTIDALQDDRGREIVPARTIRFDTLVLALGSVTNYFSVPGAQMNALSLENLSDAKSFRQKLVEVCTRANHIRSTNRAAQRRPLAINIIGAGATGVELAAALRDSLHAMHEYKIYDLDPSVDFDIRVIEAGNRILPALTSKVSDEAAQILKNIGVEVLTQTKIVEVAPDAVITGDGRRLPGDITIWAAGVSGPPVLRAVEGIEVTTNAQVLVTPTLQTTKDPDIFAIGDCAACPIDAKSFLAPRAQVAGQQADFLAGALIQYMQGRSLEPFDYHDAGSLIGFGHAGAVGSIAGLFDRPLFVRGWFATIVYRFLYRRHMVKVSGLRQASIDSVGHWLRRREPTVRLN
jgi:NADH:ubiquinone reductase (H+-translocating)